MALVRPELLADRLEQQVHGWRYLELLVVVAVAHEADHFPVFISQLAVIPPGQFLRHVLTPVGGIDEITFIIQFDLPSGYVDITWMRNEQIGRAGILERLPRAKGRTKRELQSKPLAYCRYRRVHRLGSGVLFVEPAKAVNSGPMVLCQLVVIRHGPRRGNVLSPGGP